MGPRALDERDAVVHHGAHAPVGDHRPHVGGHLRDDARLLGARPRPLIVANPDVVAPREIGLSLEPGHFAYEIAAATGSSPEFFGKPHANAFDAAIARIGPQVPPARIAMVGDTLHTDVLGGLAAGIGTVLVARHGLFRGLDPAPFIAQSGIVPQVIVATT